jgi:molybdopterin-synthase adenylyltransferase
MLHGKNPFLDVETREIDIVEQPEALANAVAGVDLLIAATDNDPSRFALNQLALRHSITTIFGRTLTRAAGGDVLRVVPNAGPCLACVFTKQFLQNRPREISREREAREALPEYVGQDQVEAVVQVGLASDIAPISNMMVKLALVELSRGTSGGLESLENDLAAPFYTWANRREGAYARLAPMGTFVDSMSVLRWYAASIPRRPDCAVCGDLAQPIDPAFMPL